ncbi:MAG: methyltransferase domain-containing protein [Minisyncoccota bacterium]
MHTALSLYTRDTGYRERSLHVESELYDIVARARASKFSPWIAPKMRVFEFGVGTGLNLAALRCRARVGYDVCPLAQQGMRSRIQFRWETMSIRSGSFDAVICHHVLEHLPEPWKALSEMRRLLVKDGLLLLNVPHEVERRYRRYDASIGNGHLYSWTPQTLGTLLAGAGFSVERVGVQPFGYDRFAARVVGQLGLRDAAYRALRKALLLARPRYEIAGVFRKN